MRKTTPYRPVIWQSPPQGITVEQRNARLAKRDAWLREIAPQCLFHQLFDLIPGIYFFAKNRQGEIMFTCQANRNLYHIQDETETIGLTDFDLNPSDMAQAYVHDDEAIYASGQPLLNRVELWFDAQGMPDWFVTTKMPVRSRSGEIIGIMGFMQSYDGRAKLLEPFHGIAKGVGHIRENYAANISIDEVARISGFSVRQLQRKFKDFFGLGPQQFLIKTRLLAACRALRETENSLAEVAFSCGFSDQSAFARHFRAQFGLTPREYRRQRAPE